MKRGTLRVLLLCLGMAAAFLPGIWLFERAFEKRWSAALCVSLGLFLCGRLSAEWAAHQKCDGGKAVLWYASAAIAFLVGTILLPCARIAPEKAAPDMLFYIFLWGMCSAPFAIAADYPEIEEKRSRCTQCVEGVCVALKRSWLSPLKRRPCYEIFYDGMPLLIWEDMPRLFGNPRLGERRRIRLDPVRTDAVYDPIRVRRGEKAAAAGIIFVSLMGAVSLVMLSTGSG